MAEVGIREFKNHMGSYLHRMRQGETIILTDRGTRIGRIVPEPASSEERLWAMVRAGKANWNGGRFTFPPERERLPEGASVAALILEDREAGESRLVP